MKFNAGKASLLAALTGLMVFGTLILGNSRSVSATTSPDSCDQEFTYNPDEDSDSFLSFSETNNRVQIDFNGENDDRDQVIITAGTGYLLTSVKWENENGSWSNYSVSNPTTTINVNGNNDNNRIDEVEVKVKKVCSTPTPVPSVNVDVCHQDGQSGNYSDIAVSVHSVDDANGLNGHGNHDGDVWAPFTYNNVQYPGQGNYGDFDFEDCSQEDGDSTPIPTPMPSPSPTPEDCEGQCPTPSATPTPEPTPTPGDLCTNMDGFQGNIPDGWFQINTDSTFCRQFQYGGAPTPPPATAGQVLGASTMAATGGFMETLYQAIMGLGGILTLKGLKKGKKASR